MTEVFILITIAFFLRMSYNLGLATGKARQQSNLSCVSQKHLKQWENTLEIAEAICLKIQPDQTEKMEKNYDRLIEALEDKEKYWKDAYFYLNKQNEE